MLRYHRMESFSLLLDIVLQRSFAKEYNYLALRHTQDMSGMRLQGSN